MSLDPSKARKDLAVFAEMVGWPMTGWQAEGLALDSKSTVLVAGRQMGKSRSLALLSLWWAFSKPGQVVLVVSAGEEASRRLLATARRIAASSPLLAGSVLDEGASLLRLTNESVVRSVPASERQIRGWSADLLLVDEAAMLSDDLLLGAAFPTTAARPDARIVLASTPLATEGAFYRNAMSGLDGSSPHVRTFTWKAKSAGGDQDAPWISREVIEHQEATLASDRFRREYLCEWSASSDVLFTPSLIESCSADLDLPALDAMDGPAELFTGLDWAGGTGRDRTVLAGIGRLPVRPWNEGQRGPVFVAWLLAEWQRSPIHEVAAEIVAAPPAIDLLSSESNGLGLPATDELRRLWRERVELSRDQVRGRGNFAWRRFQAPMFNPVPMNSGRKADAYFRLKSMCERGQIVFARNEGLLRELTGLRVEMRPTGTVGIEAASLSGHDDRADAVMLATGPNRKGPVSTVLSSVVAHPEPEAAVEGDQGEMTQTPGGLLIPRRPAIQSVRGQDLTVPARRKAIAADDFVNQVRADMWRKGGD